MADGDRADFDPLYHPRAVDRENRVQPPSSRVPGPACFYSTAPWLRAAFAEVRYDIHHAVADGDLVAVNSTMNGRHVAPWAVYTDDGAVDTVFPPTNKTFATTQSHWFRIEDGRIIEHWANRDDLGTAKQLGWIPPTPAYLFKMARAKRRDIPGTPVTQVPLVVGIPGGAPTGQVFNDTTAFTVPGTGKPALFIFAGEDGDLSAWNQLVVPLTSAVAVGHTEGAVYKGLALVHSQAGPRLLAANFHDNRIDVFDGQFTMLPGTGMFRDPSLPAGYAPFNVAEIGGQVFVTYALQDAAAEDDVAGPAHGFVDVYTDDGAFVRRFASHSVLNSPWGMTIAPPTFGQFAGDLLIGNFGDGRIHAFDPRSGEVLGTLRGTNGRPLAIDGLWALLVGDAVAGGPDAVWFSAGPDGEQHGLLGILRAS